MRRALLLVPLLALAACDAWFSAACDRDEHCQDRTFCLEGFCNELPLEASEFTHVAVTDRDACAGTADGDLVCWGDHATTTSQTTPRRTALQGDILFFGGDLLCSLSGPPEAEPLLTCEGQPDVTPALGVFGAPLVSRAASRVCWVPSDATGRVDCIGESGVPEIVLNEPTLVVSMATEDEDLCVVHAPAADTLQLLCSNAAFTNALNAEVPDDGSLPLLVALDSAGQGCALVNGPGGESRIVCSDGRPVPEVTEAGVLVVGNNFVCGLSVDETRCAGEEETAIEGLISILSAQGRSATIGASSVCGIVEDLGLVCAGPVDDPVISAAPAGVGRFAP